LQLIGHMDIIMDENNFRMQDEEVISCTNGQGCKIVVKPIIASCKWQLVAHSCKCIGCILGDFYNALTLKA